MAHEDLPLPPELPSSPPGTPAPPPTNQPPIPLDGPPAARMPAPPLIPSKKEPEIKDTFRELIETIVFVVVLVLMLKTFLAEAFVIPTGSMATTLLGYHYKVTCDQCGILNLVNATNEAEPPKNQQLRVDRCQCINCKNNIKLPERKDKQ